MSQTIVALATPQGKSGIAVLRLSGDRSLEVLRRLIGDLEYDPAPRKTHLKKIYDPETSEVVDESLITYFKAPQSFTGEDVVEISCHGSPILIRQVIDFCLRFDARLARAGEFSLRALANGRMDLSQVEAIRDLIEAQTIAASRQSVRQLRGELSDQLQTLKDDLLNVIVFLESTLEFVEDDLPELQTASLKLKLNSIVGELNGFAESFRAGKLIRSGIRVALVGRPNVGKSSLFNALLGQERAIVTDVAGTTRDSLHEKLTIKNIPISIVDTAGLRDTADVIESIGVDRTKKVLADSDLILVLLDISEPLNGEDRKVISEVDGLKYIIVLNKTDVENSKLNLSELPASVPVVKISAKNLDGIAELQNAVVEPFLPEESANSGFLISDARHFDLLNRARYEIEISIDLLDKNLSEEIVLVGLHNAIKFLGEITGESTTEDMLNRIFSTFCIGK